MEIKKINELTDDIIEFMIKESYILFCKLKGYSSDELNDKQKEQLRDMYISIYNDTDKIYVAYDSNLVIGCAYINDSGYLSHLFVKKEYQNQGIGSLLLRKVILDIEESKEITIKTHAEAINFYKKHDFIVSSTDENYVNMKR